MSAQPARRLNREPLGSPKKMVIYRFTRKLINKGFPIVQTDIESDTIFGDWYADYIYDPSFHTVLFTSERTLLPIVIPSHTKQTIIERFIEQLRMFLQVKGIDKELIEEEIGKMKEYKITKTINRRVLGTMNEFKIEITQHSFTKHLETLLLLSAEMAEMPCGAIDMQMPIDLVKKYFSK
jgi:hypothetical protein